MHRLINLVLLCACASVSVSHVLTHTTNDLDDTASGGISGSDIEESDVKISSLDIIVEYVTFIRSSGVVGISRYRRSFIGTDNCPAGEVRLKNRCVTCSKYEEVTEEDCPLKQ